MNIFLVGGAVRDQLLDNSNENNENSGRQKPHDRDWVVVGATPERMKEQGFQSVGKDFPVFLHPDTKEEYALARKERKTAHGYTGFEFDTSTDVTLEEDLSRRDLTLNAIAQDQSGQLIDPYHGQKDIQNRLLRHVSPAFCEDPVRVLRLARFAARFHHLGFSVAPETVELAKSMAQSGELNHLVAERVWKEFEKALGERHPEVFISTLRQCHALKVIMPELDALFGVPQPEQHHPEIDSGVHSLMVLEQAASMSESIVVRFASLMHDLGKAVTPKQDWPKHHKHEHLGLPALKRLCDKIKVPNEHRELAKIVMAKHTHCHRAFELKEQTILTLFKDCDAYRKPERFIQFLLCCKADARGRLNYSQRNYPQANYLLTAFKIANSVQARPFVSQGLKGKEIQDAIHKKRKQLLKKLTRSTKDKIK